LLNMGRPIVLAHTGGEDNFPASTLFSYEESVKAGVDVLDLNVLLTKDNVLLVQHDDSVDRNTNGTGPYVLKAWEPDKRILMQANPAWWDKIEGNATEVVYTPIKSDATRVAALLSGDVDLLTDMPTQDVARLRNDPKLKVLDGHEVRALGAPQHAVLDFRRREPVEQREIEQRQTHQHDRDRHREGDANERAKLTRDHG